MSNMRKIKNQVQRPVIQIREHKSLKIQDNLCVEEPLAIYVQFGSGDMNPLLTVMRTPGDDTHLVYGFLFSEGLIRNIDDVISISADHADDPNRIDVVLAEQLVELPSRRFSMNSSCGLCGRLLIEDIERLVPAYPDDKGFTFPGELLGEIGADAKSQQELYLSTGASHAASLFSLEGNLVYGAEDIGRHNAVDKLIGKMLINGDTSFGDKILLVSGRASYELVQKAVMAGIRIMVAVGAPSSLALSLAQRFDLTLVGFLRPTGYTIYNGHWRLQQES